MKRYQITFKAVVCSMDFVDTIDVDHDTNALIDKVDEFVGQDIEVVSVNVVDSVDLREIRLDKIRTMLDDIDNKIMKSSELYFDYEADVNKVCGMYYDYGTTETRKRFDSHIEHAEPNQQLRMMRSAQKEQFSAF